MFTQNYSFQDYRNDHATLFKINRHISNKNIDSLKLDLTNYKNRLGFTYYQCKALIANHDSDLNQLKYLDSAFMFGMMPLCINNYLHDFDSTKVFESFNKNYLRAYNHRLLNLVDSIHYKDQEYRQQMNYWYKKPDAPTSHSKTMADGQQVFKFKEQTKKRALDSLWKLQSRTDSSNLIKLNEIIDKYGWPGAKKVGDYYCKRPAPDVTILLIHLGNTRRDLQITTLKKVIELAEKQEESWQNACRLIFGLHSKFSRDFSEFSFLDIQNNHLNIDKSFFSIYNMSEMIINSEGIIEIKCTNISLFNEIKKAMLSINNLIQISDKQNEIRKELGLPMSKKLDDNSFTFIESKDLKDNVVLYRIVKK